VLASPLGDHSGISVHYAICPAVAEANIFPIVFILVINLVSMVLTGIAAGIIGTTGPVGFLIGGIAGIVVGFTGLKFGRKKITKAVETVPMPGAVLRKVLWKSRFRSLIENGRKKCYESVKEQIGNEMEPQLQKLSENIWQRLDQQFKQ